MRSEPWFDDLRTAYAASLPAKVGGLRELAADLVAKPADGVLLDSLAHALHRLAGSAGSYGFPEISSALGPWARLLVSLAATGGRMGANDLEELQRCLGFVASRANAPGRTLPARSATGAPTRIARVAVIDESVDDRRLLSGLLQIHYEILPSAHGVGDLALLRRQRPDLVLVDVSMPDMSDGMEFVRRLRTDPGLGHVPAIALTMHATPDDRRRLLAAGFDGHLAKPIVDDSALLETAERCLRGASSRRAEASGRLIPPAQPA